MQKEPKLLARPKLLRLEPLSPSGCMACGCQSKYCFSGCGGRLSFALTAFTALSYSPLYLCSGCLQRGTPYLPGPHEILPTGQFAGGTIGWRAPACTAAWRAISRLLIRLKSDVRFRDYVRIAR